MALYSVATGGTIQAADVNQFAQVLTGVMTDQPVTVGNNLTVTGNATINGTLAATQVNSHGNPVAEGTSSATHVEAMYDSSSSGSLATGGTVTKTLTCARAFPGNAVAVGASCQTSAGNKGAIGYGITSYGYDGSGHINAVTVAFQNLDSNPQTLSGFSILAVGA